MANPRKFSEKIALHHQKQAEETAAFEEIMRDVANVTNKVCGGVGGGGRGLAPALGPLRAGSLPDVSLQTPPVKPDETSLSQYGASPDSVSGFTALHSHHTHHHAQQHKQQQQQQSQQQQHARGGSSPGPGGQQQQSRGRPAGVGPMRARPMDRKIDTSPYGSATYLSPPPDSSWRRTNSDSALHQSSTVPAPHHHHLPPSSSPHHHHQQGAGYLGQQGGYSSHHSSGGGSSGGGSSPQQQGGTTLLHQHHHYSHSHQGLNTALLHHSRRDGGLDGLIIDANTNRPRSSCEVPRVPGIHIYPSAHDTGGVQIPVGSNTGSLPDLTSVHFPPLHGDHQGTPYNTSPASASPATLSPTSVATTARSPHHSPRHSPHGSPTPPLHHYTNHNQNVGVESPWIPGGYQQQCSPPSLHSSHSNINIPSPTMGVSPIQISNNGGYRSPRSPGSSPGGGNSNGSTNTTGAPPNTTGSSSGNGGGGVTTNGVGGDSPNYDTYSTQGDNYYINQALQHHFEQFSMDWAQLVQSLVESGVTWTAQVQTDSPSPGISYISNVNTTQAPFIQNRVGLEGDGGGGGVWAGGGPCLSGPAPNTPTTIPDIILTDFSNPTVSGDLNKDLSGSLANQISKELSASIGGHFETSLFPEDDGFRDSLGTIDFDGFQMLTDPGMNVISDPTTEDVFRQDRL